MYLRKLLTCWKLSWKHFTVNLQWFQIHDTVYLFWLTARLPKWFGERPGKKSGDPDSPDDEEEGGAEAAPVDDYAEEEEEEEEEEVNFFFFKSNSN